MADWKSNPIVAVVAIIIIVAVVVFGAYKFLGKSEAPAEGKSPTGQITFKCNACGNVFTHTVAEGEMGEFQMGGGSIKCPKCGKNEAFPATKCSMCGTVYTIQEAFKSPDGAPWCPKCKKAPPAPAIPKAK